MKYIFFSFIFLCLTACNSEVENRVYGDQLTVYFPDAQNEALAKEVALYWKNNDLLTGVDQDLQLISVEGGYQLNLIKSDAFKNDEVSFEDQKLLTVLSDSLEKIVFKSNLTITICNNKFEPIYKVN